MKSIFSGFLPALFLFILTTCKPHAGNTSSSGDKIQTTYDSTLAASWGGDEYGMKSYVLVLLKRGPNRSQDSIKRAELQAAHMANISRLAKEGKLLVAGPMFDTGAIRGIYLFDVRNVEEAKKLTETDPAIQAGSLIMEMHPWYGSASMMEIPKLHPRGVKKSF
ncbi:MAG: YciI family protein [Saprospiraceae bacterium]